MNGHINTAFDVMKEYMVIGAEFDGKYQIPIVESCNTDASLMTLLTSLTVLVEALRITSNCA